MTMLAILPAACLVLLYCQLRLRGYDWRRAFLASTAGWAAFAVLVTEFLSLFGALTRGGLAAAWGLALGTLAVLLWRVPPAGRHATPPWRDAGAWALLTGNALILVTVGVVALLSPPNTVDAMSYHMPRIVYWLENQSVANFPSSDLRQLFMAPGAEYLMLQLHALSGGDRFDNLVQCLGLGGSAVAVSGIAAALGADPRAQLLAAVISITIPQGILEASGSKNDYVLAFWLAAFCYFLLALRDRWSPGMVLLCGTSLGLACLTKSLACLFGPVILVAVLATLPRTALRSLLRRLPLVLLVAAVLNTPVFVRNYRLAGSIIPNAADDWKLTNDRFGLSALGSNLLRNLSLHAAMPSQEFNRRLEGVVKAGLGWLGEDSNDPATTWYGEAFHVPAAGRHEALAGNPLHLLLAALAIVLAVVRIRRPGYKDAALMGLAVAACFVLSCWALKWQPWHVRLHLPLFVLAAPVVALVLGRMWPPAVNAAVGMILLWVAAPFAFGNEVRPLLGPGSILNRDRAEMYFADRGHLRPSYTAAADLIKASGCSQVGIDNSLESFDYPFLALVGAGGAVTVRPVGVANISAKKFSEKQGFQPCAVFCPGCAAANPKWRQYGQVGGRVSVFDRVAVFSAAGEKPSRRSPCSVDFVDGWYPEERDGSARWRWAQARAEIRVYAERPFRAKLGGELMSVVHPNAAEVIIKGNRAGLLPAGNGTSPFSLPLSLGAGENVIVLRGVKGPVSVPGDARLLSIGVRNLRVEADDGSITCE